jgi:hypothetical protein
VKRAGELDKPRPAPFSTLLKQSFDHKERTGAKEKNGCDLFHHYAESQDDSHHQGMHHAGAASPVEQHHEPHRGKRGKIKHELMIAGGHSGKKVDHDG